MGLNAVLNSKKIIAAGGLAMGLAGLGLFAGVSAADPGTVPDTGTYDDATNIAQESCWGGIPGGGAHQPFSVGGAADAGCVHSR